jgi:hypothetical protein
MTIAVSTVQHVSGTHSLAVTFKPPLLPSGDLTDGLYRIQVSLCGGSAIDLGGKRLQGQIFVAPDPGTTFLPNASSQTYDTPGGVANEWGFIGISQDMLGMWIPYTTDILPSGAGVSSETNIGFEISVKFVTISGGTIYFDDLSVL